MTKNVLRILLLATCAFVLNGCDTKGGSSIVIPPGDLVNYNTAEFLKYSDANYTIKLRKADPATNDLSDVVDMTPANLDSNSKLTDFHYIIPKGTTAEGVLVLEINSKSNSMVWRSFVTDVNSVVTLSTESTLLYDLIFSYRDIKPMTAWQISDIAKLQTWINTFSAQRKTLFGVDDSFKQKQVYSFLKNGIGSNLEFLGMVRDMGMLFNYDANGIVQSLPYPFGLKNNQPIVDDARTTTQGNLNGLENVQTQVNLNARDPDGDTLFQYFQFEDGSVLKNQATWTWVPDYTQSRATPYVLKAFISDGSMIPLNFEWDVLVADNNRVPHMSIVSGCGLVINEGETWTCTVAGNDPDDDDRLKFQLLGGDFPNAVPTLNGVPWVDGMKVDGPTMTIVWTPTNRDFLKAHVMQLFQIDVQDYTSAGVRKNGDDVKVLNVVMNGVNTPPAPVDMGGGVLIQYVNVDTSTNTVIGPTNEVPRVLDTGYTNGGACTQSYFDIDTKTCGKRFYFQLSLYDTDNDSLPTPMKDIDDLRVNLGSDKITLFKGPYQTTALVNGVSRTVTTWVYSWRPTTAYQSLYATFTPLDDMQNGQGVDFTVTSAAQPRALVPACQVSGTTVTLTSNLPSTLESVACPAATNPTIGYQNYATLADVTRMSPMTQSATSLGLVYTKTYNGTTYSRREASAGSMLSGKYNNLSPYAGAIRFVRTGLCDSNNIPTTTITIPIGTKIATTYNATPYVPRITYSTQKVAVSTANSDAAGNAVMTVNDCEIIVPVTTSARVAAANSMTVIPVMTSGMTSSALTVKNPAAITYDSAAGANFTFTRPAGNSGSALTIPAGTQVRSAESATVDSFVYYVAADLTMAAGATTLTAELVRDFDTAIGSEPANALATYNSTWDSTNGVIGHLNSVLSAGVSVSYAGAAVAGVTPYAPSQLFPRGAFPQQNYRDMTSKVSSPTYTYTFVDGSLPALNDISLMSANGLQAGTEPAAATTARSTAGYSAINVRNAAWTLSTNGPVEFYRATAGASITIPAGTVVTTADRRLYQTDSDAILAGTSITTTASRIYEANYLPVSFSRSQTWGDYNHSFSLVVSTPTPIPSGTEYAFNIDATDTAISDKLVPQDPYDRYFVYEAKVNTGPSLAASEVKICREKTGACTPCSLYNPSSPKPASTPIPATDPYSTLNLGTLSHEASRDCYLRVTPSVSEVAQTYYYNVTVCDNATAITSCPNRDIQFYVSEANTMPYFTLKPAAYSSSGSAGTVLDATNSTTATGVGCKPGVSGADANGYVTYSGSPVCTKANTTGNWTILTATEGASSTLVTTVYAYDQDKDAGNKTLTYSLMPYVWDVKAGAAIPTPSNLKVDPTSIVNYPLTAGAGNLSGANVVWAVTDKDAKAYSTAEGLIIGIKVNDNASNLGIQKSQVVYYNLVVKNQNNAPIISGLSSSVTTVQATSYFKQTFTVTDADWSSPPSPLSFATAVSACWNADGTPKTNAAFDGASTDPKVCHVTGPEWGSDSFDYNENLSTAGTACHMTTAQKLTPAVNEITKTMDATIGGATLSVRNPVWSNGTSGNVEFYRSTTGTAVTIPIGTTVGTSTLPLRLYKTTAVTTMAAGATSVLAAATLFDLNTDLVTPKITQLTGPTASPNVAAQTAVSYSYQIEWCPQKKHLGSYAIGVQVVDNGDMDRQGNTAPRKSGAAPVNLKVVAPIFLTSPGMDTLGNITKTIRQTAAGLTSNPFTYQVIAKNSLANPLTYTVSGPPGAVNPATISATGLVTWLPDRTEITNNTPATNKVITVTVKDTTTSATASAKISLWVQDPLAYPTEQGPSVFAVSPSNASTIYADEMVALPLSIDARDPNVDSVSNDDKLFARIYVDGVIFDDQEMVRPSLSAPDYVMTFNYKAQPGDANVGATPLTLGLHKVRIDVTDGNFVTSTTWNVQVRNTIPTPSQVFALQTVRRAVEPAVTINFPTDGSGWTTDVAATTTISGNLYESLYFGGWYNRAGVTKYFVWALDWVNGVQKTTSASTATKGWNYNENLSANTSRISYQTDPTFKTNTLFVTNSGSKYNIPTSTTTSVQLSGDIASLSNPIPSAYQCTSCQTPLYMNNVDAYGYLLIAKYSTTRNYWVLPSAPTSVYYDDGTTQRTLAGVPAGYSALGIAVNPATKRLFVSVSKNTATENKVLVYDLTANLTTLATQPTLIASIDVSAQASWTVSGASTLPEDIAIDNTNTKGRTVYNVMVYLKGTGGLFHIVDDPAQVPYAFATPTIGVGSLPASSSDTLGKGNKLVYDAKSDLFRGVSKESQFVFTVDPTTASSVLKPSGGPIDAIWVLPTGRTFMIDRKDELIFQDL